MKISETTLPGVLLIEPKVFGDDRGFFMETYRADILREAGITDPFVQDNHSRSARGVLRGLHHQEPNPQGKLVRCTRGAIFDVAVDIRRGSPSFGRWFGVELSDANKLMLWIPPGFAHGFCALEDDSDLVYKCTKLYDAGWDRSILWNDPAIGIEWPITEPLLSARDAAAPLLSKKDAAAPPLSRASALPDYSSADAHRDKETAALVKAGPLSDSSADAHRDKETASVDEGNQQPQDFDVFLCHNSLDKPAVKEIARSLAERGVRPWLDEWEIAPFARWQDELEKMIPNIKSVVVFIGPSSALGPWQDMEIKAFLQEFTERQIPLGMVLLPGATKKSNLPLFLKPFRWVDFNQKDPDPLAQLIWGITGKRPTPYES